MQVQLRYHASSKLHKDYLAQTGEKLPWPPYITVELATLTPAQQAIIKQAGIGPQGQVEMPLPVSGIYEGLRGDPELIYDQGRDFDTIPSVAQWLEAAQANLATHARWQPVLEEIQREYAEAKQAAQAEADRQREVARVCLAEIEALEKAGDLPGLQAYRAHYDRGLHNPEGLVQSSAFNRVARALGRAIGELERQRREAEKAAWIEAHGSDRLKRGAVRGDACQRLYVIERAAKEAPGFTVDYNEVAEWEAHAHPSAAALETAAAASRLGLGRATIVRLTAAPSAEDGADDMDGDIEPPEFEPVEAVVIQGYLDRYDLIKPIA